jgi:hypothetical protein
MKIMFCVSFSDAGERYLRTGVSGTDICSCLPEAGRSCV